MADDAIGRLRVCRGSIRSSRGLVVLRLRIVNLDGGVHQIPLPEVGGRLWLCGKHAIAPRPDELLDELGADRVVCLVEADELNGRYPEYITWLTTSTRARWFPMEDMGFVGVESAVACADDMITTLIQGTSIVTHCAAGMGRAGTLAVIICLRLGMGLDESLSHVRLSRPGAGPQTHMQTDIVTAIARR